jgi:hypothetical protein
MRFFVPHADDDELAEDTYTKLAHWGWPPCPVPPAQSDRVYAIRFVHDGEEWTATVGESLTGTRTRKRTVRGHKRDVTEHLSDPAVVLAIYVGNPYKVVTTARPLTGQASKWENPFLAGVPTRVEHFEA